MRLKTAPRIIIGVIAVGAAIYGVNYYIDNKPKKPAVAEQVAQPVAQPQEAAPVQPQQAPVTQQQPTPQPAPAPAADRRQDAGLNALIGGSK